MIALAQACQAAFPRGYLVVGRATVWMPGPECLRVGGACWRYAVSFWEAVHQRAFPCDTLSMLRWAGWGLPVAEAQAGDLLLTADARHIAVCLGRLAPGVLAATDLRASGVDVFRVPDTSYGEAFRAPR